MHNDTYNDVHIDTHKRTQTHTQTYTDTHIDTQIDTHTKWHTHWHTQWHKHIQNDTHNASKKTLFILLNTIYKNRSLEKIWNHKYFSSSLYELNDKRI